MTPDWVAVVLAVVVVLVALAWYLTWSAGRLDRLHHRVQGARGALGNQLLRRAAAAADLASSGVLDPASSVLLAAAAGEALEAAEEEGLDPQAPLDRDLARREAAESDLSRVLRATLGDPAVVRAVRADPVGADLLDALDAACLRVVLARRFHNDAVWQAQRVRGKRVVRWTRLAGRAPMPQTVEIDDEPPDLSGV